MELGTAESEEEEERVGGTTRLEVRFDDSSKVACLSLWIDDSQTLEGSIQLFWTTPVYPRNLLHGRGDSM